MAIQDENWEEAEQYLLEAIKVEPENAEIMVQIGYHVHARKKEWKKMNEMFNSAVSINPEAKTLGRPVKEVTKNYREMYWAENYNKAVRKFNSYKKSQDKSILEDAIGVFNESVSIDPSKSQTYSILATCYYEMGEPDKAIESGKLGYEKNPEDFQTNFTLGQILSLIGDKKDALFHIEKSVQLDPSNTDAVRQLATLYYDNGNKEKSVKH
jgi:Cytochrome c biogenesis factor